MPSMVGLSILWCTTCKRLTTYKDFSKWVLGLKIIISITFLPRVWSYSPLTMHMQSSSEDNSNNWNTNLMYFQVGVCRRLTYVPEITSNITHHPSVSQSVIFPFILFMHTIIHLSIMGCCGQSVSQAGIFSQLITYFAFVMECFV